MIMASTPTSSRARALGRSKGPTAAPRRAFFFFIILASWTCSWMVLLRWRIPSPPS